MKGFQVFKDKNGNERILRHLPPIFISSIIPYYEIGNNPIFSKAFEINGKKFRVVLDETYQEASSSKLEFLVNKAAVFYQFFKSRKNEKD